MTIDERIEALVQTVELAAGKQVDLQKKMDQTSQHMDALLRIVESCGQRLSRLEGLTE